jgi:hypothetical protein
MLRRLRIDAGGALIEKPGLALQFGNQSRCRLPIPGATKDDLSGRLEAGPAWRSETGTGQGAVVPGELFRQDAHNLRVNLIAGGNHVFVHRFFKRQRRRTATFRKLKRGNPDVCVDDDDHPLDCTLRRRGFSARTS